jgi:hypothetical protein
VKTTCEKLFPGEDATSKYSDPAEKPETGSEEYCETVTVPEPLAVAVTDPTLPAVPIEAVAVPPPELLVALFCDEGAFPTMTTVLDTAELALVPTGLVAVTVNEYASPTTRLETVTELEADDTTNAAPDWDVVTLNGVTVYPLMDLPPLDAGVPQLTVA